MHCSPALPWVVTVFSCLPMFPAAQCAYVMFLSVYNQRRREPASVGRRRGVETDPVLPNVNMHWSWTNRAWKEPRANRSSRPPDVLRLLSYLAATLRVRGGGTAGVRYPPRSKEHCAAACCRAKLRVLRRVQAESAPTALWHTPTTSHNSSLQRRYPGSYKTPLVYDTSIGNHRDLWGSLVPPGQTPGAAPVRQQAKPGRGANLTVGRRPAKATSAARGVISTEANFLICIVIASILSRVWALAPV